LIIVVGCDISVVEALVPFFRSFFAENTIILSLRNSLRISIVGVAIYSGWRILP
jgi:hypothetical protein